MRAKKYEYKVVWRRQGNSRATHRIYQKQYAARQCVKRLIQLDIDKRQELPGEPHPYHWLKDLVDEPKILCRVILDEWTDINQAESCYCNSNYPFTDECFTCIDKVFP